MEKIVRYTKNTMTYSTYKLKQVKVAKTLDWGHVFVDSQVILLPLSALVSCQKPHIVKDHKQSKKNKMKM